MKYEKGAKVIWRHKVSNNWLLEEPATLSFGQYDDAVNISVHLDTPILVGPNKVACWILEVPLKEIQFL